MSVYFAYLVICLHFLIGVNFDEDLAVFAGFAEDNDGDGAPVAFLD